MVPIAVEELDEAHAALRQAPRQKAIGGERPGLLGIIPIELEDVLGLVGKICQVRH